MENVVELVFHFKFLKKKLNSLLKNIEKYLNIIYHKISNIKIEKNKLINKQNFMNKKINN